MNTLKKIIKEASGEQRELKNQRKTVNLVGERKLEPWQAAYKHTSNRESLRVMHAAYGLLRGKTFSQIENTFKEENHPLKQFDKAINLLVRQYEKEFIRIDQQAA